MGGRGTASGLASTPTASAAAPAPAPAPTPQPTPAPQKAARGGLVSDTGIQNMDDAALTSLIQRALSAPRATDGRDDTPAQRIADALGISKNQPESVSQEEFAQYRSRSGDNGLLYRTVNDTIGGKTARQIAHELTDETGNYGFNYGGGRAYGVGLYFAASGPGNLPGGAAYHSAGYGRAGRNPYTIEAMLKPGARIANSSILMHPATEKWALAHKSALNRIGCQVSSTGRISSRSMDDDDLRTTVAMLMGYDGYKEDSRSDVYHTIFNRGALRVARGNKYSRARNSSLT